MQIRNNNNIGFTASMIRDKSVRGAQWNGIASEVERQTKTSPEYEIRLFQENDKFEVYIDRGRSDELTTRSFILSEAGSNTLSNMPEAKIVQKFKKMLNLVKAHDKALDNLPDDIAKLEKKYDIQFNQNTYDNIADTVYETIRERAVDKIWNDPVLADAKASVLS